MGWEKNQGCFNYGGCLYKPCQCVSESELSTSLEFLGSIYFTQQQFIEHKNFKSMYGSFSGLNLWSEDQLWVGWLSMWMIDLIYCHNIDELQKQLRN